VFLIPSLCQRFVNGVYLLVKQQHAMSQPRPPWPNWPQWLCKHVNH
jgi:hypothetical protein